MYEFKMMIIGLIDYWPVVFACIMGVCALADRLKHA